MDKVLKYGLTLVAGGAVLFVGWGSMKIVTPTPEQMRVVNKILLIVHMLNFIKNASVKKGKRNFRRSTFSYYYY